MTVAHHWLLVANGSRARIIETADFEEIECFVNEKARLDERDLTSDGAGRFSADGHGAADESHHKDDSILEFADAITEFLDGARNGGRLSSLSIIAAPKVLGLLRKKMDSPLKTLVKEEFDKDLTQMPLNEIKDRLVQLRG